MKYEILSQGATGTAPPVFVRQFTVTVASARHSSMACQLDVHNDVLETRPRVYRPYCKRLRRDALRLASPATSDAVVGSPQIISKSLTALLHSGPASSSTDSVPSVGGKLSAVATPLPEPRLEAINIDGCAVRSLKRRADLQDEPEESGSKSCFAHSAKRLRTCTPTLQCDEVPLMVQNEASCKPSDSAPLPSNDETLPTPTLLTPTPPFPTTTNPRISSLARSLLFPLDLPVPPSPSSKWQSPRTSPLGPQTSQYQRRSRISPVPSAVPRNPAKAFLMRNLYADNITRNPYYQSPQWCEDLHLMGLARRLHPTYKCPHDYHPSDEEYNEEWSHETWSDEEWSDDEDTLDTPTDDQCATNVRIVPAEEQPPLDNGQRLTFTDWNNWHPPLIVPSQMPDIHLPPAFAWNVTKDNADREARTLCGEKVSISTDVVIAS